MLKTFEYRLFTNRAQDALLLSCLAESRRIYNEMLEVVKDHHSETGKVLSRYDLTYHFKGRGGEHVPQSTVQTLADRLDRALKPFFRRKELGQKVGFPRFKSPNRWHSIQLRQYGSGRDVFLDSERSGCMSRRSSEAGLRSSSIGRSKALPRALTSSCGPTGIGTCSSSVSLGTHRRSVKARLLGLTFGVEAFLADSDGETVENPRCYRQSQKKPRRTQRKLSRRKKGSGRHRKARVPAQDSEALR